MLLHGFDPFALAPLAFALLVAVAFESGFAICLRYRAFSDSLALRVLGIVPTIPHRVVRTQGLSTMLARVVAFASVLLLLLLLLSTTFRLVSF